MMSNSSTSVLGLLFETEGIKSTYHHFVANEVTRGKWLEQLIKRAHNKLSFRSGELNPRIWNNIPKIINALRDFLQDKEHIIEFTFTKRFSVDQKITGKDVKRKLEEENPEIVTLAKNFPDQVKLYFLPVRLLQHCQINDNGDIIFEELEHTEGEVTKWVDVVFNHKRLSSKWIKRFENLLKRSDIMEITFA